MQTMGETVLGMRIVKAFNLEDEMRERMEKAIRVVERSANRMAAGGASATLMADSLAGLAIGFAIFYGSWRVSIGHGDVGAFVSFLGALLLAYEPAKRLGRLNVDIQNGLVSARLIYEVLDAPQAEAPQPSLPETGGRRADGSSSSMRASPFAPANMSSTISISSPNPMPRPRLSGLRAAAKRRYSASFSDFTP